jgi:hypothetical protein
MTWTAKLSENSRFAGYRHQAKGRARRPFVIACCGGASSALTRLEARVALADHEYLATATNDLAVAMPRLGGFE